MKRFALKKLIPEITSIIVLPIVLLFIVVVFDNQHLFITYSDVKLSENVSENKHNESLASGIYKTETSTEKMEISSLAEGLYDIQLFGKDIVVFDKAGELVYKIDAEITDFSKEDVSILSNGISDLSREDLIEITAYLES